MKWILIFFSLWVCCVKAQQVGIGEWESYYAFGKTLDLVEGDGKVVWVAEHSALYYDFDDKSMETFSKVEGLTGAGLVKTAYNANTKTFILGYNDGNIDLLSFDINNSPTITNMSDIKRSSITGDKTIYNLYSYNNIVYVSCGFGIVAIDLVRHEVKDTYIIGPASSQVKVNGVAITADTIYASTENGIYKAYEHHPFLSVSSSWTKMNSLPAWLINMPFNEPAVVNGQLFIVPDYPGFGEDTAYYRNGTVWAPFPALPGADILSIQQGQGSDFVVVIPTSVVRFNASFTMIENLFSYNGKPVYINNGIFASDGFYYTADVSLGPYKCLNSFSVESLMPGGTKSAAVRRVVTDGDQLWVAAGQVNSNIFASQYNSDFFSVKEGNTWTYINGGTDALLNNQAFDAMDVAIDPTDKTHVTAAFWSFQGLAEINNKVVTALYDETNSGLVSPADYPGFCPVSSVAYDEDGNLWCINGRSNNPLVVKTKDGSWKSFYCGTGSGRTFYDLVIDNNGYKYLPFPTATTVTGGLAVYNDNKTISDESDDAFYIYKPIKGSGNLPDADVRCVSVDLDGQIWIGTAKGPTVIFNPGNIFSGTADAQQILIQQDGNTQILLETEVITCIKVDGANRKWIGTEASGAYLVSQDGQDLVYHFTSDNSPLPSNNIADIEINGKTGEVFFATTSGLLSYRGTATESKTNFDNIKVFPNPVRPEYNGVIAVNGLSRDSDIKVTDIAGNIVNVVKSEGGQAIWDGKNLRGERVKSGVYLFLCSSEDGSSKVAAKVMFIE